MKKLLIVIPYRNRQSHLDQVIPHLDYILGKQNIMHTIVVVEQNEGGLFNRGLLCNIGFYMYQDLCDYVCFHDVDMICHNIDYSYSSEVTPLVSSRTKNLKVYDKYIGGITLFPKLLFIQVNGFSNNYWGWGAEDDDLYKRCLLNSLTIKRRDGVCKDLETVSNDTNRTNNPNYQANLSQLKLLKTIESISKDGLSNVNTFYIVNKITNYKSYIFVQIGILK